MVEPVKFLVGFEGFHDSIPYIGVLIVSARCYGIVTGMGE